MAFDPVPFPLEVYEPSSTLGPGFQTLVKDTIGGASYKTGRQSKPRNVYTINLRAWSRRLRTRS